jgi:hypothetical protein
VFECDLFPVRRKNCNLKISHSFKTFVHPWPAPGNFYSFFNPLKHDERDRKDSTMGGGRGKSIILLKGSKVLPTCPSNKGGVKVKTLVKNE